MAEIWLENSIKLKNFKVIGRSRDRSFRARKPKKMANSAQNIFSFA